MTVGYKFTQEKENNMYLKIYLVIITIAFFGVALQCEVYNQHIAELKITNAALNEIITELKNNDTEWKHQWW